MAQCALGGKEQPLRSPGTRSGGGDGRPLGSKPQLRTVRWKSKSGAGEYRGSQPPGCVDATWLSAKSSRSSHPSAGRIVLLPAGCLRATPDARRRPWTRCPPPRAGRGTSRQAVPNSHGVFWFVRLNRPILANPNALDAPYLPTAAQSQESTWASVHGSRCLRVSMALASSSSRKRSAAGSQRSLRPRSMAMLPMWAMVIVRWPISKGA